jgi:hypothetical protein
MPDINKERGKMEIRKFESFSPYYEWPSENT